MHNYLTTSNQYRRSVLKALLWATFIGGSLFFIINTYRGLFLLASLELLYGFFSLLLLKMVDRTEHLTKLVLCYLTPHFSLMMFALSMPNTVISIYAWILTIPVMSYLLLGRKIGFWFSIIFVSLGLSIYGNRFIGNMDLAVIMPSLLNIALSTLILMAFAHVYERNREDNEQRLLALAGTDLLTGLANRMALINAFEKTSALAIQHNKILAIAIIDLDYFKQINDQFGHNIGDKALCHVADLLNNQKAEDDTISRFGGEEFAIIMTDNDNQKVIDRMESMRTTLINKPLILDNQTITMTFSAGIAFHSSPNKDLNSLLIEADNCLYQAKKNGRNCVVTQPTNSI